jgi:hypothetical protein
MKAKELQQYEVVGRYLRKRDASSGKPSPLIPVEDVLREFSEDIILKEKALLECAVAIEVLGGEIRQGLIKELSPEMKQQILVAGKMIRSALFQNQEKKDGKDLGM